MIDIVSSVDMIRFSCLIDRFDLEKILKIEFQVEANPNYTLYSKFGWKDYKYNFKYDDGEQNFWFAYEFMLVDKVAESSRTFVLEYNPNKNRLGGHLLKLLRTITLYKHSDWVVKGCDVALDLKGVKRDSIFFDRCRYQRTLDLYENGSKTSYIGHRGWGSTKIYDKAKEQGLCGCDWVRVEFTIKLGFDLIGFRGCSFDKIDMSIPNIYSVDYMALDDIKLKSYFHLIASGLATVSDFGRVIKEKLKETAISSSGICIDNNIKPVLISTIVSYLELFVQALEIDVLPF